MGFETIALGLAAGASAAETAAAVGILGAYGTAASALGTVYSASKNSKGAPTVAAPEKPPQAAKAPDAGAVRQKNADAAIGPLSGNSSTFLTGTGGVDPTTLALGKSTLLGQ